ncbi:MAG: hypothetical protein V1793_24370 [Pseudomonadota bacterium]
MDAISGKQTFFFEIIDPDTGQALAPGRTGEVVITTLTREGMPLVRYRTGDTASLTVSPCPCGSRLQRMVNIKGRLDNAAELGEKLKVHLWEMDERIFAIPGVLNYQAKVTRTNGANRLSVIVHTLPDPGKQTQTRVFRALMDMDQVRQAAAAGLLELDVSPGSPAGPPPGTAVKRRIEDRGQQIFHSP